MDQSPKPTVSPGNPCPFLRALTAGGFIDSDAEPVSRLADLIADASGGSPPEKRKVRAASFAIASIAHGLFPSRIFRTVISGLHAGALRGGPLDKRGSGSRILDRRGEVDTGELDRLDHFAADFPRPDGGGTERGLGAPQLRKMMDENFARAAGKRRAIDRRLMEGEWPVLWRLMGRGEGENAHLSLSEIRALFVARELPARILERISKFQRPSKG